jgi:hypothetical protein
MQKETLAIGLWKVDQTYQQNGNQVVWLVKQPYNLIEIET